MEYFIHLAILVGIYLILAQSFNLTFGLGGLLNLAHVACYAIGAYTTALLATDLQQSFWICLPAAMASSSALALLLGAISLRLKQDYFAIGSLAFAAVVSALLINWKSLTRGVLGIPGIPRPETASIDFYQNVNFLAFLGLIVVLSFFVLYCVFHSRFARQLQALSENEPAGSSLGVNVTRVRNMSFVIASGFAGLAGGIFAYYINYIDPTSFGLNEMVFILSIAIIGKPGSFWGVTLATVFLVLLPEPLRFVITTPSILGPMRQFLYALILFAVVYWKRHLLFPLKRLV